MALLFLSPPPPTRALFCAFSFWFGEYMWFHNDNRIIFNTLFNLQMRVLRQHVKNTNFNGFPATKISTSFCTKYQTFDHSIREQWFYFQKYFLSIFIIYSCAYKLSLTLTHTHIYTYAYAYRKKNFWKTLSHLIWYKEKHQHSKIQQ